MMKIIKERHPGVNLTAIDYDASATQTNQENRIKLMLANAAEQHHAEPPKREEKREEEAAPSSLL